MQIMKKWPAVVILVVFLIVGTLYAVYTPIWQAPDEPAHYNYVRSLAEGRGFPVMAPGDYDQAYLSRLTSEGFPPELSVASLEYEDHQPPLYYLLATPVYWLGDGAVIPLRLFSLLLGAVAIAMLMAILREFWPERPGMAWLGGGIVAFIPQFVAMMAAINNDALTLALLWLWLWLALRYLRGKTSPWVLGGVLGLLLLTKSTAYGAVLLAVLAIALRARRTGHSLRWSAREVLIVLGPALVLGALWWTRNVGVYGWPDVMGLIHHDAVVTGQPRTLDWIARDGLFPFLGGALRTTFRSFWGQFGWMTIPIDRRFYLLLLAFTLTSTALFLAWWLHGRSARRHLGGRTQTLSGADLHSPYLVLTPRQSRALTLLAWLALFTLLAYLWYNLQFVQHQGRYLFPALIPISTALALGWGFLFSRRQAIARWLWLIVLIGLAAFDVYLLFRVILPQMGA